jgi:micrococcal nuclease
MQMENRKMMGKLGTIALFSLTGITFTVNGFDLVKPLHSLTDIFKENQNTEFTGEVIRISDGDTLWVEKENGEKIKIRVYGIDTPEKYWSHKLEKQAKECKVDPESIIYLGKLASKHAHLYLYPKEEVKVISYGKGYYGRLIGKIILPNGKDYGYLMVKDGYACVYKWNTSKKYIKAMREAEKEHKGLWGINPSLMHCLCYY